MSEEKSIETEISNLELRVKNSEGDIDELKDIAKEVPKMQGRVNMLMTIMSSLMLILISISTFTFFQLMDFKETYFEDREADFETTLEQERRYIDLINKLGERVSSIETENESEHYRDFDNRSIKK